MFVTNWISTTKIQKISEITKFFRHYFLSRTEVINDWVDAKDMPLIVRKDIKFRGQSFIHPTGREIIVSDNTFAIWVYGQVMKQHTPTLKEIKEMLQNNMIPMLFMRTKDGKQKAKYSKPLGTDALQGWKLCHIEPIGFNSSKSINEIDIHSIEEHFRKYANPYNMFVLPKEIGDLGEIQVFIDEQRRKKITFSLLQPNKKRNFAEIS